MSQILVRNVKPEILRRLKKQACESGRSLQSEVARILERAAEEPKLDRKEFIRRVDAFRRQFKGRKFSNSTEWIREDRDR